MNSKVTDKYSELIEIFDQKTGCHKAHVKFFVSFICAMCKLQTVSFVKFSQGLEDTASQESNLRRIQRFFAQYVIDFNLIAKIIFGLLPKEPPYQLSTDI